jgi:2-methylisocitrate lyase-like PEP mutase family enzyme
VDEWKKTGVKMVIYWYLPLFAAIKAVERAVVSLRETGSSKGIAEDLCSYSEYTRMVDLEKWLEQ